MHSKFLISTVENYSKIVLYEMTLKIALFQGWNIVFRYCIFEYLHNYCVVIMYGSQTNCPNRVLYQDSQHWGRTYQGPTVVLDTYVCITLSDFSDDSDCLFFAICIARLNIKKSILKIKFRMLIHQEKTKMVTGIQQSTS